MGNKSDLVDGRGAPHLLEAGGDSDEAGEGRSTRGSGAGAQGERSVTGLVGGKERSGMDE